MSIKNLSRLLLCFAVSVGGRLPATAQQPISPIANLETPAVSSRVVERVDDTKLFTLAGNTHLMARPAFDQGEADPQLLLERMQLVLRRSAAQESALERLMAEQLDPQSVNYHRWLTPEQFGKAYGPSDGDIAAVTSWLQNHGFSIDRVSNGRVTIEFSGTVEQVKQAFHTEIHNYLVNGKMHVANDRDPQIPEALAPVVTGIASLHNFFPKHQSMLGRMVSMNRKTHKVTPLDSSGSAKPQFLFPDPTVGDIDNEDIGPYDFAAMYNLTPLWNAGITGKGLSIAIAAATDINLTDVATFRRFFGLSKFTGTAKMVLNGADPGTIQGAVVENTLDTEWSGAAAPDAQILVVATKGTATSFGGLLSISYIVDKNLAPIMSASYGTCEAGLGAAGNANLNNIFQQGSAEGISMFESAGDQGSTGCDNSDATVFPAPAENGLQVNGFASSPYITGVGGTDIVWQEDAYSKYWTANTANNSSAIGYIPEVPWNSTCTSSYLLDYVYTGQTSSEELCNNAIAAGLDQLVSVVGGSGGKSSCLSNKGTFASCSGAYAKPSWQTGVGVPADSVRDVPDVSLFASGGLPDGNGGSAYLICVSSNSPDGKCDYSGDNIVAQEVGGTSVSSPAMAGIMALVVQKAGKAQGLANPKLYALAAKDNRANCNSNTVANGNSCVFYDVTTGTNAMPCLSGTLNCVVKTSGDEIGIVTGYGTTTGYDLATGLGSVNAYNLVNAWTASSAPSVTLSPTSLTFASTSIGSTTAAQLVTVKNTGTAALTLTSETVTGTNAASFVKSATTCGTSLAAGATCTVSVEFKPAVTGALTASLSIADNATGSPQTVALKGTGTADVTTTTLVSTPNPGDTGAATFLTATVASTIPGETPTGTVTFTWGPNNLGTVALAGGVAKTSTTILTLGDHTLTATYSGAANFLSSVGTTTENIEQRTTTTLAISPDPGVDGSPITFTATAVGSNGGNPGGNVEFLHGSTVIGTVPLLSGKATLTSSTALTYGNYSVTAIYEGDSNYHGSSSAAVAEPVLAVTTTALKSSKNPSTLGSPVVFTATVLASSGPTATGTVTFKNGSAVIGTVTLTSGVATLSYTLPKTGTFSITATYNGAALDKTSVSPVLSQTVAN